MDDRDFFDHLHQLFARTTGAEGRYWRPIEDEHRIVAVGEDDDDWVAAGVSQADMEWITAVHGCFPDLVRRLHAALDEADRADQERDVMVHRVIVLEQQVARLRR